MLYAMKIRNFLRFSAAVLLFAALVPVKTAAQSSGKYPIAGVWQAALYIINDSKVQLRRAPIFKILGNDGSMCNLNTAQEQALFTQQGTYEMTSDSTYVEKLLPSALNGGKAGEGRMKYRLDADGKILYAQWFNSETGKWQPEMYVKVELPL